ncbi:unnamed protein product [Owenia fusiformis]|uniref:IST1 homolog n=1 Tax=Owenia fusiformis TaxID=6347 RepID=A0A8S4NEG5_OWEFU|nr:unnamed protein product [Owenia fusiformis]
MWRVTEKISQGTITNNQGIMFSSKNCNYTKLKTNLRLVIQRLKLLEKKKTELALKGRKEIADYISANKDDRARIRVEHIVREDYLVEALEILEMYCDLLLARFGLIERMKELDPGLEEAVATLLWASPRLQTDIQEFKEISRQLTGKYSKEFAEACSRNTMENVNEVVMRKMSIHAPPKMLIESYMCEIAKSYNVPFEPDPSAMTDNSAILATDLLIDFNSDDKNNGPGGGAGGGGGGGGRLQPMAPNNAGPLPGKAPLPPGPMPAGAMPPGEPLPPYSPPQPPVGGTPDIPPFPMSYSRPPPPLPSVGPNASSQLPQPPAPGFKDSNPQAPVFGGIPVVPMGSPERQSENPQDLGPSPTVNLDDIRPQVPSGPGPQQPSAPPNDPSRLPSYGSVMSNHTEYPPPLSNLPPPPAGGVINSIPNLPEVPGDLPELSLPGAGANSAGGNDVDFDDLTRRFEELKKKK